MLAKSDILHATDVLRRGGLVGMPTETVYGLAADAENPAAVLRIFAAKGRPSFHPLIVHIASSASLDEWAVEVPESARELADRFWPGPLTMILRRSERVPSVVTGDLASVGLRVPSHPVARALLAEFGGGLAAPSANRFGRVSPTTAEHVREELGDRVDLVLEGGACEIGLESTIVDLTTAAPTLLRFGAVTPAELQEIVPTLNLHPGLDSTHCSGRLESHYAPRAAVEIGALTDLHQRISESSEAVAILSACQPEAVASHVVWFPMPKISADYARCLYSKLREVDRLGLSRAVVVLPEQIGIGLAIADRMHKAAAPRP
jgi:L-threonylcarbamoyladenylate synthase